METRARYVLVGLFALVVIVAGFGFVYWINNSAGLSARTAYQVRFDAPVSGLIPGAAVLFNGIRVGEVTSLQLNANDPRQVLVGIAVAAGAPVHADTAVGLEFGGLTGTASITLTGGTPTSPLLAASDGQVPVLVADVAATQGWTQTARDAFQSLNNVLADNADSLKDTIANVDEFSKALARNSDKVDSILKGLASLAGGGDKPVITTIDLAAPTTFPPIAALPETQLLVASPTALVALDTQRIIVQSAEGQVPGFETVQWSDSLPILIQAKIVESFENANYLKVSRSTDGFDADFQLQIDIRDFDIRTSPSQTAEVTFAARVVNKDGRITGALTFRQSIPVNGSDAAAAAAALNEGFGRAVTELVPWTLANMPASTDAPAAP